MRISLRFSIVFRAAVTGGVACTILGFGIANAVAQDWPMYRGDAARSAYTRNALPESLQLQWQFRPSHAPSPAWPRRERMEYDRAFQPIVAGHRLFFGSSTDGTVRALDTRTGQELWKFDTDAPVRFAPAAWQDRVFVASDDGYLYCLGVADGVLLWKKRGGPDGRRFLGNGYMISRWPARGGPVVHDDKVYFAAGIWQSEGIFIYALDAKTGATVWVNEDSGDLFLAQPHGGASARSGVSAQGHLVATDDLLLVPTGRAVPAAFDLKTGAFRYYHLQKNGHTGGTATMASGKYFFNNGVFFDAKTGAAEGKTGATAIAGLPDGIVTASRAGVVAYRWGIETKTDKKGKRTRVRKLMPSVTVKRVLPDKSVIVAGDQVLTGGDRAVGRISLRAKKETWAAAVDGVVHGLVVADRRLFATTDTGSIYCFGGARMASRVVGPAAAKPVLSPDSASKSAAQSAAQRAAAAIVAKSGVKTGYCLDLGCGDGALALALLRTTDLQIIAIDSDVEQVRTARRRLRAAGMYGSRVMVHLGATDATAYPNWFADLVVSGRSVASGHGSVDKIEAARVQRPHGGVVCLGRADDLFHSVRGALAGEGTWTHQYADPANSVCSNDEVRGPLGVLWFADVAQQLTQRHGRGPAPLYAEGRLFSLGLHSLVAVDAYNGRVLWEHPFPNILTGFDGDHLMGTAGSHGMYCLGAHGVYVRNGAECFRIDPATGKTLATFHAPAAPGGKPTSWGYIAAQGGLLFGSLTDPGHVVTYRYLKGGDMNKQLTESRTFFALDAKSGELRWRYDAEHSIRHNAIAISDGSVFLIDRPQAEVDQMSRAEKKAAQKNKMALPKHAPGALLALDANSGAKRWEVSDDVFGTLLALSEKQNALMMSYQPTRFRLDSEVGGRLAVFDLRTGKRLWQKAATYQSRPVINDATIYAQGGAWEVRTGVEKPFPFQRSYGCGILASGRRTMVYRSATLGYYDLETMSGNEDFGGIRPGCWINAIPAGGMVLVPDGSAGCRCSYQNKTWLALRPDDLARPTASPGSGMSKKPLRVALAADPGTKLRFTIDGTSPTEGSALYRGAVSIAKGETVLKVRAFRKGAEPSRVSTFRYVVDANLIPLDGSDWQQWDVGGKVSAAPGRWEVVDGVATQSSNIFSTEQPAGPDVPNYGTLRIYQPGHGLGDGSVAVQIRSADNDGIGLAFRVQDAQHHYLLHMDQERKFRVLARRDGAKYTVLARDTVPYATNRWIGVRVELAGARIVVFVDEKKVFEVEDSRYRKGTVALHSWGSTGVSFRGLKFSAR